MHLVWLFVRLRRSFLLELRDLVLLGVHVQHCNIMKKKINYFLLLSLNVTIAVYKFLKIGEKCKIFHSNTKMVTRVKSKVLRLYKFDAAC